MSRRSFFAKRIPFFGNRAMMIMCLIFFLLPFVLRGTRESVDNIKNDVADWLPETFAETQDLKFFSHHFVGDQFVVVSWDGCNEQDPNYHRFYEKIRDESLAGEKDQLERLKGLDKSSQEYADLQEEIEARQWATELALQTTGSYHEDWGVHKEKWLLGKNRQWYFIRQDGSVFRWHGQNNLVDATKRFFRGFLSGKNEADGTFVKRFGTPVNNRFYRSPELLCGRFFVDVTTGPDIFRRMAGPEGTMRIGQYEANDQRTIVAEIETHKRLSGILFGPTPVPEFKWTFDSLVEIIPEATLKQISEPARNAFGKFVTELVEKEYKGDIALLQNAPQAIRLEHWYNMWLAMEVPAPPRQTCFLITLNKPVLGELARVVGRPVLGKSRGRILEIASGACGIAPEHLHMGGPPVDNVAIDEEGSITLFRLAGLSAVIGLSLAWLSFRSIPVTLMVFFAAGLSALTSLAIVWFSGGTMDAILMTMPSLVYVMGISGSVHLVNYYKEACHEQGEGRAPDTAFRVAIYPSFLAAFTTALGLLSLCTSELVPINKFGFYSAIAVMATFLLLFAYIPASLTLWPPGYGRKFDEYGDPMPRRKSLSDYTLKMWVNVGEWLIRNRRVVISGTLIVMIVMGAGLWKIKTSVQLLKLFRSDAKVLNDYRWMEENLGKLVPMEVLLRVDGDLALRPEEYPSGLEITPEQNLAIDLKLDLLQRIELSDRVRRYILQVFGDESIVPEKRVIGNVMSTDLTTPLKYAVTSPEFRDSSRDTTRPQLEAKKAELYAQDFLRLDKDTNEELWRISLRLAALNDIDYGQFVGEIKTVVEPVLAAYRYRQLILKEMHRVHGNRDKGRVLVFGPPVVKQEPGAPEPQIGLLPTGEVDQTALFINTLSDLLQNSGFLRRNTDARRLRWVNPETLADKKSDEQWWKEQLDSYDVVVVIDKTPNLDMEILGKHAKHLIAFPDYKFLIDQKSKQPLAGMQTAADRKKAGDDNSLVKASYTGIVPIVYKAQHSLLHSLIESIIGSFIMISVVMMILLRSTGQRLSLRNLINFRGGLVAMLPNVFPIIIVFGFMGHSGQLVDIGSMMTASVALGIAVDDTIHFLTWFRKGIAEGMDKMTAIRSAYKRVAQAMTETTFIAGFGLAAFAFSTFMPTQRFGIFMLFLLFAALYGDLILLPALLASRLGNLFCNVAPARPETEDSDDSSTSHSAGQTSFRLPDQAPDAERGPQRTRPDAPHMLSLKGKRAETRQ
jgi:uncharacterized protein